MIFLKKIPEKLRPDQVEERLQDGNGDLEAKTPWIYKA
jgi:hypothetical protein